jgi:F-box protein 3
MLPVCYDAGGPEFSYTSCMNQGEAQGSMEGAFSFAPGNLTTPSGPDFEARVRVGFE